MGEIHLPLVEDEAKGLPRRPDYHTSLWVLPEFNGNEDSYHQDGILCSNLLGKKEGFIHFRGYHHFHQCLIVGASDHIQTQQNCQVRGGKGGRCQQAVGLGTKKPPPTPKNPTTTTTTKNPTLSNAERREDKSIRSGQHNGKQDSCH